MDLGAHPYPNSKLFPSSFNIRLILALRWHFQPNNWTQAFKIDQSNYSALSPLPYLTMEIKINFQAGQIVFLEYGECRLYAEVIQVVIERNLCWVRPLLFINQDYEPAQVTDLRSTCDIIWPISWFQPALDTQVIGLYSKFLIKQLQPQLSQTAKQQLHHFIQELWQGNQNQT